MGQLINERYELIKPLGQGASSTVFEVMDLETKQSRALKLVWEGADEDLVRGEFARLSRLDHACLVKVHDLDRTRSSACLGQSEIDPGRLFLVADLVVGMDPASAISRVPVAQRDGWLRRVTGDLASALDHLHHHGLVHHDLKPDNFMILDESQGEEGDCRAMLFDLGLSSRREEGTMAGRGTLAYMAPEALMGGGDHRVDLYSLGGSLFQLVAGRPPFAGGGPALIRQILEDSPRLKRSWLSPELHGLVLKLLDKAPLRRPQSARRVLLELSRMAGDHEEVVRLSGGRELLTPGFAGRVGEAKRLDLALSRLHVQDAPRVIWVVGPPGAGKSRLVEEALRKHRILAAAGKRPASTILSGTIQETLLSRHDTGLDKAGRTVGEGSALALADALEERSREGLLVVHLRVEGQDPLSLELLQVLERSAEAGKHGETARQAPRCLVIAEADAMPDQVPDLEPNTVELQPLGLEQTGQLIGSMLGQAPLGPLNQRIHVLSQGVPALVVELTRLWHRGGDKALEGSISEGLDPLLQRSRDWLDGDGERVMDALAAWGAPCSPRLLGRLADLNGARVGDLLDSLSGRGISLVWQGGRASLPSRSHVEGWRKAAGAEIKPYCQKGAELLTQQDGGVLRIADLLLAGELPGAAECTMEAAAELEAAHQAPAAILLLARAASGPGRDPAGLKEQLARLLVETGQYDEALALLDLRHGGAEAAHDLDLLRARALQLKGSYEGAEAVLKDLIPRLEEVGSVKALSLWGRLKLKQGQPAEALVLVAHEADGLLAEESGWLNSGEAGVLEVAGLAQLYLGNNERADQLFAAGAGRLDPEESPDLLARFHDLRGMVAFTGGQLELAGLHYQAALDLAGRIGDRHGEAQWAVNLGSVQLERGRFGPALGLLTRATRDLERLAQTTGLASSLCNLSNLLLLMGDLDSADRQVERARDVARRLGSRRTTGYTLSLEGDLLRRRGKAAQAQRRYQEAAALFAQLGARREEQLSVMAQAEALGEAGHLEEGRALLAGLKNVTEHGQLALTRIRLLGESGAGSAGPADAAALARHCARLEQEGNRKELWRAAAVLARHLDRTGEHEQARAALGRARRTWEEIMKETPEVYHESMEQDPDVKGLAELWPALLERSVRDAGGGDDEAREEGGAAERDRAEVGADVRPSPRHSMRRLLAINKRLNSEHRLPNLLDYIIDTVIDLTEAERGFLLLAEPDGSLQVKVARNIDSRALELPPEGGEVPLSLSIAEQAARSSEPVITVDAVEDGRFAEALSVSHLRLRSVLAVPLMVKGRTVGTLYVDHRLRQGVFGDEEVSLVQDLADQAAIAIENARLLNENNRRQEQIQLLNEQLMEQVEHQEAELDGVREELRSSRQALGSLQYDYRNIVGRSPRMMELFHLMDRITETDLPVVIQGESGTGKELVARAIHLNGKRAEEAFVGENCGAIPETLLESVLFGHVKGAFTGADRERRGLFEVASGGTLFLDEVGETSPAMQTKLLRVLQDGEVRRVGGDRTRTTDVRIIAASNKDLSLLVEQGVFREDLFYRLNVVLVPIPPLRERREDVSLLVEHFLSKHSPDRPRKITRETMAALMGYAWPGNVRELENEVMRVSALAGEVVRPDDLSLQVRGGIPLNLGDADDLSIKPRVEHLEKELITRALKRTSGNNTRAAELLSLSRYGLLKKLKRYGIVKAPK